MAEEQKKRDIGTGGETQTERVIGDYLGTGIHLFLSVLVLLLLIASVIIAGLMILRFYFLPGKTT